MSVFSALTVLGSFIHLPGPIPTIAFDSAPGFFVALLFGPIDGALVSGIGHLATASINGFPLGAVHLPVALGLAGAGFVIGAVNRLRFSCSLVVALALGVAVNVGLIVLAVPVLGWQMTLGFAPFLAFAATLNALVAGLVYFSVRGKLEI